MIAGKAGTLPTCWLVFALMAMTTAVVPGCGGDGGDEAEDMSADTMDTTDAADFSDEQMDVEDAGPDVEDLCVARYVVHFETDDGVRLEAELSTAGVGTPAVVLLHMSPPTNDRTNWPDSLIEVFNDAGVAVLNVDRRGAGGSEGVAEEAYEGPNGVLDAKAAWDYLALHPCLFDIEKITWVGASNGTTTVLDFAALAASESDIELPAAIGMLSPGTYTENQTAIADVMSALENTPLIVMYPETESEWPEGVMETAPASWEFVEYPLTAHGTGLLEEEPGTADELVDFIAGAVR